MDAGCSEVGYWWDTRGRPELDPKLGNADETRWEGGGGGEGEIGHWRGTLVAGQIHKASTSVGLSPCHSINSTQSFEKYLIGPAAARLVWWQGSVPNSGPHWWHTLDHWCAYCRVSPSLPSGVSRWGAGREKMNHFLGDYHSIWCEEMPWCSPLASRQTVLPMLTGFCNCSALLYRLPVWV